MEINEIKKLLYKRPVTHASLQRVKKGVVYYFCTIFVEALGNGDHLQINFAVPVEDMGEAEFLPIMEAKHLIRWIVKSE